MAAVLLWVEKEPVALRHGGGVFRLAAGMTDSATADENAGLMLAFGRGDSTAFETLYRRYKGGGYRYFCAASQTPDWPKNWRTTSGPQ